MEQIRYTTKNLISFIILFQLVTCLKFGSYDSFFDPGRIVWPKEKWYNNPIELSQTNAGSSSVTITFNFRPSTTLNSALVQIIFPSSFSAESNKIVAASYTETTLNLQANTDSSVYYVTSSLPTSVGAYGPFGILTRHSATGQIVDVNYIFGCIATTALVTSSAGLTVTRAGTVTTINTDNVLKFSFTLSQSLWAHDIIEIVPDSAWTPKSRISCKSTSTQNLLIGPDSTYTAFLPCALATKSSSTNGISSSTTANLANSVYIYGISQDVYLASGASTTYTAQLEISSFTAPGYATSTSFWTINIWRFGTNSLIAQYTTSSGVGTTSGAPSASSWVRLNTILASDIMQGMTLFTKVTVTTANPLVAGSTLSVIFSSQVNIRDTIWWSDIDTTTNAASGLCHVSPYIEGAYCSVLDATSVMITFKNAQAKGSVSFVILSYFSGSNPQITGVKTNWGSSSGAVVDQSSSLAFAFTVKSSSSTNYYLFSDLGLHALNQGSTTYPQLLSSNAPAPYILTGFNGQNQGGVLGSDLFFRVKSASGNTWGGASGKATVLSFNFKKTNSFTFDSFGKVYIGDNPTAADYITTADNLQAWGGTTLSTYAASPSLTPTTSGTDSISISFTSSSSSPAIAPGSYYILRLSSASTTSLPYIASNKATNYEMWAKVTYSSGSSTVTEIGTSVFSVLPQITTTKLYTAQVCTDWIDGIPIVNYFEPLNYNFDFSSYALAIDIVITGGYSTTYGFMGTGIKVDSNTQKLTLTNSHFTSSSTDAAATLKVSGTDATITLNGFKSTVAGTTKITTYFPSAIATLGSSALTAITTFYYIETDPNVKFKFYETEYITWSYSYSSTAFDTETSASIGSGSSWFIGTTGSVATTQRVSPSTNVVSTDYVGISLSAGFTFSGIPGLTATVDSTIESASSTIYLPSSSSTSIGGFILATAGTWADFGSWGYVEYNVKATNIMPPNYAISSGNSAWSLWIAPSSWGAACKNSVSYTYGRSTVAITELTLSPAPSCTTSSVSAAGPDSVNISGTFFFTTSVIIPANGLILFTMNNLWTWPSSSYTCNGFACSSAAFSSSTLTIIVSEDIPAGSYNVGFSGALPPIYNGATNCFTALRTQTSNSNTIESWISDGSYQIYLSPASSLGASNGLTISAYPNVAGLLADLLLSFRVTKKVPASGIITITSPSSLTWSYSTYSNIQDYCWTNIVYTSCQITSSSTIAITLSADLDTTTTIQIYLDRAITFSVSGSSGNFFIAASWSSIIIIDDTSTIFGGASLNVGASVAALMTLSSITADLLIAGEKATYTFTFTSGVAVASGDYFYIQFPRQFDAYIGDADNTYSDCLPNNYYLPCSSSILGNHITCMADHWYLVVSGISSDLAAFNVITLTVSGVRNAPVGQTDYFNMWHYNSNDSLEASVYSSVFITTALPVSNIGLRPILVTNHTLAALTTYSFDFYPAISLSTSFNSDKTFNIVFPQQFNLNLYTSGSVSCTAMIYDETSTTSPAGASWASGATCSANRNLVTFSIPNGLNLYVKTTDRIRISLLNVNNPQFGLTRSTGWDIAQTNYGSSYSYWSNKFDLYVVDTANKVLYGKTYGVLNSGYLGYIQSVATTIDVNGYNGITKARHIQLLPGQQSGDIPISIISGSNNIGLKSQKLVLTPKINSNYPDTGNYIKFTSIYHKFVAFQLDAEIMFRVSAATGSALGIYYIDWTTEETHQDGVIKDIYSSPLSVMVEVCNIPTTGSIAITVDTLPTLYPGYTSIPISVYLESAPATNLIVTPSISAFNITANPTSLTFAPDTQTLYFELTVTSTYSITQSPILSFNISGTDSAVFIAPASVTLIVSSDIPTSSAALTLSPSTPTGTSVTITVNFSQDAVIYWGLTCYGTPALTYSKLKSQTQSLISPNSNLISLDQQLAAEYQSTETHIDYTQDTDITSFFKRIHQKHCNTLWTNAVVSRYKYGRVSITLNWLMDGTHYNFYAYADNKISSYQPAATIDFTTSAVQSVYSTSVTFTRDISASLDDSIRRSLAKNIGVNPDWLISKGRTTPSTSNESSRFLPTSTIVYSRFNYIMIYDRRKPSYSPSYILNQLDQTGATNDLTEITNVPPTAFGTPALVSTGTVPTWKAGPFQTELGDTNATFNATSSQDGIVCVSCTELSSTEITYAWQVVDGLDAKSNKAYGACVNATAAATVSLTVSGLTQATIYTCYFTACNSYPTHSYCIDVSSNDTTVTYLRNISLKTIESKTDAAICLSFLAAIFLIFY